MKKRSFTLLMSALTISATLIGTSPVLANTDTDTATEETSVQSSEIFDMAEDLNISKRTLENAKKELEIKARRIGNSWYWDLDKVKPE